MGDCHLTNITKFRGKKKKTLLRRRVYKIRVYKTPKPYSRGENSHWVRIKSMLQMLA
jgi:hypothetical protein